MAGFPPVIRAVGRVNMDSVSATSISGWMESRNKVQNRLGSPSGEVKEERGSFEDVNVKSFFGAVEGHV